MSTRVARGIFGVILICIAAIIYQSSNALPDEIVANSSRLSELPGRDLRGEYQHCITAAALLVPLLIYLALGRLPVKNEKFLAIPHRDFWLVRERKDAAVAWIEKFGMAVAAASAVFVLAMHAIIVDSNLHTPPNFELGLPRLLGVAWILFIALVVFRFKSRFKLPQ